MSTKTLHFPKWSFIAGLLAVAALACNILTRPSSNSDQSTTPAAVQDQSTEGLTGSSSPSVPVQAVQPVTFCDDPQPLFVTGFEVLQTPQIPLPAARQPFRDPVFGMCVVRVTDSKTDLSPDDNSSGMKNEYSRVQAFNADESLIMVRGVDATWYLYDARTLQSLGQIPITIDPRWDAVDPDLLYYNEDARLMAYRVSTGESRLIHDFAGVFPGQSLVAVWTRYEGSPSRDGRYWGLMAQNQDWQAIGFVLYDRVEDRVTASREIAPAEVDTVTISPSGRYFLAYFDQYCERGQTGNDAHPCGLMVYDQDLQNGRNLFRLMGHSDLAYDVQNREVLVFQDVDNDNISMIDLESGEVTPLWPIDFSQTTISLHFSGQAFNRPGWAVISTCDGDLESHTWMDDQVFLIELKAEGQILRLAHDHTLVDENQEHDYWAEPHASANHDLTRVLFTSNWGKSGTGEVEMYMIQLPEGWEEMVRAKQ